MYSINKQHKKCILNNIVTDQNLFIQTPKTLHVYTSENAKENKKKNVASNDTLRMIKKIPILLILTTSSSRDYSVIVTIHGGLRCECVQTNCLKIVIACSYLIIFS